MGAFNTLIANTTCPVCGTNANFELQFKFGNTWQYQYEIGERLRWGGNDIGTPGYKQVLVEAIGGPCPHCGTGYIDFDIVVQSDVIVGVNGIGKERTTIDPRGFSIILE